MKISRYFFSVFFCLVVSSTSMGQVPELINDTKFRPDAKAAVDSIYNFNFDGADQAISEWKERYPEHPLWLLFDGIEKWWEVLSDLEDKSHDEQLFTLMKKINYAAGKLLHRQSKHADGLIIMAISNGFLARQHANREDWITSINYGRKAMQAHEYLMEVQPELNDLKLAEGLKLYYLAHIPQEYPIVKTVSWALPDGDKEKGIDYIQEASTEAIFASAEATYFLGNINYNYEKNYDIAVEKFEKLQSKYPRNNYYARLLVKSYYRQRRYDEALEFINKTLRSWQKNGIPHQKIVQEELWTWKGRILEKREKKVEALEYYKKAFSVAEGLPNTKGRSFYVISGYLAGKILYDQQKMEEAKHFLKKAADAKAESKYRGWAEELLAKIS